MIRFARRDDLEAVASWIRSAEECRLWAGARVAWPIDLDALPDAIEFADARSWTATLEDRVAGFGQLVPKPERRLHLARLVTAPAHRGAGLGRRLAVHLLTAADADPHSVVSLNVAPENEPALALYRSLGFRPAERPPSEPRSGSVYLERRRGGTG